MPLSELYRETRGKLDSTEEKNNMDAANLSLNPENGVIELVWESGQILLQGQSSRIRKNSDLNASHAQFSTSHSPRDGDGDGDGDGDVERFNNAKMGKFGAINDSIVRDVTAMVPSPEVESGHDDDDEDDDMVPWPIYPLDGHLQHRYSSDFLPALSGVTVNHSPLGSSFASSFGKAIGGNQVNRDTHLNSLHGANPNLEDGNISKRFSLDVSTSRPRSMTNQLHPSPSQQIQASLSHLRTKVTVPTGNTMGKFHHDSLMVHSSQVQLTVNSSSSTSRKKLDPTLPSSSSNVINFSHFLRPAALPKSNVPNCDVTGEGGFSSMPSVGIVNKNCSAANSQPRVTSLIGTRGSIRIEPNSCCKNVVVPSIDRNNLSDVKPSEQLQAVKQPQVACLGDSGKNDVRPKQCLEAGAGKGLPDSEKAVEAVLAASVCSRTSMDGASDDPTFTRKRKCHDPEDSEWHSDDVEEECNDMKRATPAQGSSFKRSRAAEVHNLSERRRRDRINEKMRALQELIPNCNKVDKVSMLDEAIEYLKMLQLQVQFMSMGAGLFMPPMMLPGQIPPMNAPHIYRPMGVGMGMGFGIGMPNMNGGSPGYPTVQVPHMQGMHFPGPSIPAQTVMHGMPSSNHHVLGLPGPGLSMHMPRGSVAPFPCGLFMNNSGMAGAPVENFGLAAACSSKDASPNMNSPMVQNGGNDTSITTDPRQANEEPSWVNGSGVNPTSENDPIIN